MRHQRIDGIERLQPKPTASGPISRAIVPGVERRKRQPGSGDVRLRGRDVEHRDVMTARLKAAPQRHAGIEVAVPEETENAEPHDVTIRFGGVDDRLPPLVLR
jgi:hypothetical protein